MKENRKKGRDDREERAERVSHKSKMAKGKQRGVTMQEGTENAE